MKEVIKFKVGGKQTHQGHQAEPFWWCLGVPLHLGVPTVNAGGNPPPELKKTRGHQSLPNQQLHTSPTTQSEASFVHAQKFLQGFDSVRLRQSLLYPGWQGNYPLPCDTVAQEINVCITELSEKTESLSHNTLSIGRRVPFP